MMTNCTPPRDAWSQEADRVRILAAQAGRPLDEDEIQFMDVFDLRALRLELLPIAQSNEIGEQHEETKWLPKSP
jgi:hypothetical protein